MSTEADKLRAEIATAERSLAELEARTDVPHAQRMQMQFQIKRVKDMLRTQRIHLAAMQDHRDVRCPNCHELMPHSFFICRPCMREVPVSLYIRLKGAIGFHHHGLIPDAQLAEIKKAVLSHLKQHGTAVPV
jgi:ribosomal protein S14